MAEYERHIHEFGPVFDRNSRILILGSFPSVKSREQQFYYGHPQNRFWKVIAALTGEPLPETIEEKRALLLAHGIALWDVIASCEIAGSSDSSIRNVVPNAIPQLLAETGIQAVFGNGAKACELYEKYVLPETGGCQKTAFRQMCVPIYDCFDSNEGDVVDLCRLNSVQNRREVGRADGGNEFLDTFTGVPIHRLPSTSPANAAYSLERLTACWEPVRENLKSL